MVAYTPELCLPYYEGTDSPCLNTGTVCEPSDVWCDLVNIVDPILTSFDASIARTFTALPIAQISYSPPSPAVTVSGTIPFNVVDMDTDNMVDLDVIDGIIPNRNGVYQIDLVVTYVSALDDTLPTSYIVIDSVALFSTLPAGAVGTAVTRGDSTPSAIVPPTIRASALWNFNDTSPVPRIITANSTFTGSAMTSAILTVSWHSEAS